MMPLSDLDKSASDEAAKTNVRLRPRDAASLLLIDRSGKDVRILMGRRHMRHVFMPGKFVFPGGRTERADGRIAAIGELTPADERNLLKGMGTRPSIQRCRALALSAIRETYEEAGLFLGKRAPAATINYPDWAAFVERGILPDLSALRYFARATTPPGRTRRFDTRFFMAFRDAVADSLPEGTGPSLELEELCWLPFNEALKLDIPTITRAIIQEAQVVLEANPTLQPGHTVVQYAMKYGRFVREVF
ncbi:NUDIX hydrolase [Phyllobacterium myrsinacearum]|uniref:8-oxo-dGTP pyrophosphatase MutT (NUDIX family) n=1 Tax=Phyllobacterium myrsinacearum TaxID=28101 RepID=A0A839EIQ1_9HYPH|nr:NUDIX hydrolase [Phyllobacterium myrsinacearum]MBA8880223.1 8-oxo-dGTP pyrophosphatase MutT (NUDIX family) [Phyllobacterium myrsinacearum]